MKKYIIILAAAACALCACQKHEIELLDKPIIEQIDANTYTYTFSAVISDNVSEVEEDGTKATVSRAGAFAWAVDDELKFFKEDRTWFDAKITAIDTEGSTATITVYGVDSRASFVSAIYPASAAVEDQPFKVNFNVRGPIVVADVTSGTLTFHHIGSVINLKFYDISGLTAIKSLVFEPASAFNYDGSFTFDGGHVPSLTQTGSTDKIVVPASNSDNNSDITVVVPSVNLSGFSAALNSESDGSGRNLFKKSTATAHDLKTKRPVLMNMKRVAYVRPDPKSIKITLDSETNWWDLTDAPLIQTSANTFELSVNTAPGTTYSIYDEYNDTPIVGTINASDIISAEGSRYVGGSRWDWAPTQGPKMNHIGSLYYSKNVVVVDNTYFKITDGVSFDNEHSLGGYGGDYTLSVGEKYDSEWNSSYNGAFKILTAGTYDFYEKDTKVWYEYAGVNDESSHTTQISYDVSTGVVSLVDRGIAKAAVANNDTFFNVNVALMGSFNSWTQDAVMTYNGNHIWSYDLEIPSAGDYSFKIIQKNYTTVQWSNNADNSYPKSQGQLYGTSDQKTNGSGNNCVVELEAGSYKVYANDYTWDSKKMKFSFVKQ